jgi:nicotinate dehydrogenase subunit B
VTTTVTPEGLTIVGEVTPIVPPRPGSYAAAAYGGSAPQPLPATWLHVRPDGGVTVFAGKVEYGQGIRSGIAVEVADELRVPLERVEIVLGDTDGTPWDMGTFGSMSTARTGLQLRKAAATARQTLLELASGRLDLPAGDLVCEGGRVASRRDPRHNVSYGELVVGQRLVRDLRDDAPLLAPEEFTVMGRPQRRIDALDRVTGRAKYSQDVAVPGMLFAKVIRPPSFGAQLVDADVSAAERLPGVVAVVRDDDLLAVLAESDEEADAAAQAVVAQWEEQPGQPSHLDLPSLLVQSARDPYNTQERGDLAEGFRQADGVLEATYFVPYISNRPMEPKAAVARWDGRKLTVWAGSQRPFGVRAELARHFGLDERDVRVVAPEIGGGFGSKSYYPVALEAARLARLAGRPVRVAYTRAEETMWSTFRPAALIQIRSGFTSGGTVVAWECKAFHAGPTPYIGRRGSETPYDTPNVVVTVACADSPLRAGSFRSLGGAVNHFARESHIDEIAAATGIDPVELRLRNLTHPRFRRVLEAAAEGFGWRAASVPSGRGAGLAVGLDVGSYVACCAQVSVQGDELRVERVVAAIDCGLTVNPEGATRIRGLGWGWTGAGRF